MPVEYNPFEKRTAQPHDHPIPIQRRRFSRRGDVIKRRCAVAKSVPDGLEAVSDKQEEFREAHAADILHVLGETCINMIALDSLFQSVGLLACFVPIASKSLKH